MTVTYFQKQRSGPELQLEAAVASYSKRIMRAPKTHLWTAGSLRIGAGMPDLLMVVTHRRIGNLSGMDTSDAEILAYLRAKSRARTVTIADHLRRKPAVLEDRLNVLKSAGAVRLEGESFSLSEAWRNVLPQIVSVEAKVNDWRKAFRQASRNKIFSHKSFIALPDNVAKRASNAPEFRRLGIGILAVSSKGKVSIMVEAKVNHPRVWLYYYRLALVAAKHAGGNSKCLS